MCTKCEWEPLLGDIHTLLTDCGELPEAGEQYSITVMEEARNIRAFITEHEHCTNKQKRAVSDMQDGVNLWFTD